MYSSNWTGGEMIWQLSLQQLLCNNNYYLRSGPCSQDYKYLTVGTSTDFNILLGSPASTAAFRPAVHLNLSAIPRCEHEYGEWQTTTPATHTTAGERTSTCGKCGKTRTEEIPASTDAHTWNDGVITSAPTCSVAGSVTYTCLEDSSHTKTEAVPVDPDAHTVVIDPAVPPSCTADGKTEGSHCSECNAVITPQQTVPALEHDWDEGVVTREATCKTEGSITYTCKRAGSHTKTEAIPIDPSKHNAVIDPAVSPTCTVSGKTEGSHCSRCNAVITPQQRIPALEHDWDEGVVTSEPTCTAAGVKTYTCKRDGSHKEMEAIPRLGHSYQTEVIPPTEEVAGYTIYTCTLCGDTYRDNYVPAVGHSFAAVSVTPPTCTENGYTTYLCAPCGETYNSDVVPALGQEYRLVCEWAENN